MRTPHHYCEHQIRQGAAFLHLHFAHKWTRCETIVWIVSILLFRRGVCSWTVCVAQKWGVYKKTYTIHTYNMRRRLSFHAFLLINTRLEFYRLRGVVIECNPPARCTEILAPFIFGSKSADYYFDHILLVSVELYIDADKNINTWILVLHYIALYLFEHTKHISCTQYVCAWCEFAFDALNRFHHITLIIRGISVSLRALSISSLKCHRITVQHRSATPKAPTDDNISSAALCSIMIKQQHLDTRAVNSIICTHASAPSANIFSFNRAAAAQSKGQLYTHRAPSETPTDKRARWIDAKRQGTRCGAADNVVYSILWNREYTHIYINIYQREAQQSCINKYIYKERRNKATRKKRTNKKYVHIYI